MADHLDSFNVARQMIHGPEATSSPIDPQAVRDLAGTDPTVFDQALDALYYRFASGMFESSSPGLLKRYRDFVEPWITLVGRDSAAFFRGALDAHETAWTAGMERVRWGGDPALAQSIAEKLRSGESSSVDPRTLASWLLRGQIESTYCRAHAGDTFATIRRSRHRKLLRRSSWDAGALSYLSETELAEANGGTIKPRPGASWLKLGTTDNPHSLVVSVTPEYFRAYGPALLFNAQQAPEVDLVILICTDEDTASVLSDEANEYLRALSSFNSQPLPQNLTMLAVETPEWIKDATTYFSCARLMAIPDLLKYFDSIYCLDANAVLRGNPAAFMSKTAHLTISAPASTGPLSVSPWRRFRADSVVVNHDAADSEFLDRLLDYIYRGLQTPSSYGLDRNALAYAMDRTGGADFEPLNQYSKPTMVSEFSRSRIGNFRRHNPVAA